MDFIVTVNERNDRQKQTIVQQPTTVVDNGNEWIMSESKRIKLKDRNTVYARVSRKYKNREINRLCLSITIGHDLIESMGVDHLQRLNVFFNREKVKILQLRFCSDGEYKLSNHKRAVGKSINFIIPQHIVLKGMCRNHSLEVLWQKNDATSLIVDLSELEGGNE